MNMLQCAVFLVSVWGCKSLREASAELQLVSSKVRDTPVDGPHADGNKQEKCKLGTCDNSPGSIRECYEKQANNVLTCGGQQVPGTAHYNGVIIAVSSGGVDISDSSECAYYNKVAIKDGGGKFTFKDVKDDDPSRSSTIWKKASVDTFVTEDYEFVPETTTDGPTWRTLDKKKKFTTVPMNGCTIVARINNGNWQITHQTSKGILGLLADNTAKYMFPITEFEGRYEEPSKMRSFWVWGQVNDNNGLEIFVGRIEDDSVKIFEANVGINPNSRNFVHYSGLSFTSCQKVTFSSN